MKKRSRKVKPGKSRKAGNLARVGNASEPGDVGTAGKTARDGKADKSAKTEKPSRLKLMARGRADFEILSALMQDAIVPGEDMVWDRAGELLCHVGEQVLLGPARPEGREKQVGRAGASKAAVRGSGAWRHDGADVGYAAVKEGDAFQSSCDRL